jgi:polar amino acid transport system permease protein
MAVPSGECTRPLVAQQTTHVMTRGSDYSPSQFRLEREAAASRAARRSTLVAAVSTFAVAAVLYVGITRAPGWDRVQTSFFSLEYMAKSLPDVLHGLWLNIRVMFFSEILILAIGLLVALARTTTSAVLFPLRIIAAAYTDVFRGLPLLLVILLLGLGVPALRIEGLTNSVVIWGAAALVLTYSAYVAEVLRAGIETVHPTQRMAARALGLTSAQTTRHVVLPQAVRRVVPPLLNDLVSLQKDSGLISVLGAIDAIKAAGIITATSFNFTPYVTAGIVFVLMTIPMTRLTDYVTARMNRRQQQGGAV